MAIKRVYIYILRWVKTNYIVSFSGMNSHLPALPAMTWGSLARVAERIWQFSRFATFFFFGIAEIPSGYVEIAIENDPFIVDLPIKDGDCP